MYLTAQWFLQSPDDAAIKHAHGPQGSATTCSRSLKPRFASDGSRRVREIETRAAWMNPRNNKSTHLMAQQTGSDKHHVDLAFLRLQKRVLGDGLQKCTSEVSKHSGSVAQASLRTEHPMIIPPALSPTCSCAPKVSRQRDGSPVF